MTTDLTAQDIGSSITDFGGEIEMDYFYFTGNEEEMTEKDLKPSGRESATHIGFCISDDSLDEPMFFWVRMNGDYTFIQDHGDLAVKTLMPIAQDSPRAASIALSAVAYAHKEIGIIRSEYSTDYQANHPGISAAHTIPLFDRLGVAIQNVANELYSKGIGIAEQLWQSELAAIKTQFRTTPPPLPGNIATEQSDQGPVQSLPDLPKH